MRPVVGRREGWDGNGVVLELRLPLVDLHTLQRAMPRAVQRAVPRALQRAVQRAARRAFFLRNMLHSCSTLNEMIRENSSCVATAYTPRDIQRARWRTTYNTPRGAAWRQICRESCSPQCRTCARVQWFDD